MVHSTYRRLGPSIPGAVRRTLLQILLGVILALAIFATQPLDTARAVTGLIVVTPATLAEGMAFNGVVATGTSTTLTGASIDWGDGTTTFGIIVITGGTFTVSGNHTYADEVNGLTITVTVTDPAGNGTATKGITITEGDVLGAGVMTAGVGPESAITSITAPFSDSNPNGTAGDFTATINWGDGTMTTGVVANSPLGGFNVTGTHTYADEGLYTITATLVDNAPGTATATSTFSAAVGEGDVLSAGVMTAGVGPESAITSITAPFSDSNPNGTASDFTATINWGDGTMTTGVVANSPLGGFNVTGTHTYADEGLYTITATLVDNAPGTATATSIFSAAVGESDTLAGTPIGPATIAEGTSFNGTLATFTDLSYPTNTVGDFTAIINWGDGTPLSAGTISPTGAGGFTIRGIHTYADEGTFNVTTTGHDDGTGTAAFTVTSTITVTESDALVGTGMPLTAAPNVAFSGTVATFTDPNYPGNVPGDFTAIINWGDGTPTTPATIGGGAGTFSVSGSHTYASTGPFAVTTTLAEDTPGTALATVTDQMTVSLNPTPTSKPTTGGGGSGPVASGVQVFDPTLSKIGQLQPGGLGLPGEHLTWEISVVNQGGAAGSGVTVSDPIIPQLHIDGASTSQGTFTISGQTVTFNVGTLNPGQTVTMSINTTVLSHPGQSGLSNTACLSASGWSLSPRCTSANPLLPPSRLPSTGYPPPELLPAWLILAIIGTLLTFGVLTWRIVKYPR